MAAGDMAILFIRLCCLSLVSGGLRCNGFRRGDSAVDHDLQASAGR